MKQTLKRTVIASAAVALVGLPTLAYAHEGEDHSISSDTSTRVKSLEDEMRAQLEKNRLAVETMMAEKQSNLRERLDNVKRKACENHVNTINKLMTVMDKRRTNALEKVTKISEAVQAFYVKKQLSVTNYDDLVAKVNAAKAVAESATQAQQQIPSLNCSGDHPRADVADFKEKRSISIDAVKAYRDAVKDLVHAVKSAAEAAKPTTSPTTSPEGGNQ